MPGRFYEPPDWRFVVTDLTGKTETFLDRLALSRAVTYTLNTAAVATFDVPSDNPEVNIIDPTDGDPYVAMNNRLIYGFRRENPDGGPVWMVRFAGILMQVNDEITTQTDVPTTHCSAFDPWQYLLSQPVLAAGGVLPGPGGLGFTDTAGSVIVTELLNNLQAYNLAMVAGGFDIPVAAVQAFLNWGQANYFGSGDTPNTFYEGTIETTVPVTINFDRGTMLGDAFDQLTNQGGYCDIIIDPIYDFNQPGILGQLSVYQLAGSNKYGAVFGWDKPSSSLLGLNRLDDGQQMVNVAEGYAGQGGDPVFAEGTAIGLPNAKSLAKFGPYWLQQFYPAMTASPAAVALLAETQLVLRAMGKLSLTVDPSMELAPVPFQEYKLGDFVPVYASKDFRAAMGVSFTGAFVVAANTVSLPVTIVTATNDEFVYNGHTYTIAAGTYTNLGETGDSADFEVALNAATGSPAIGTVLTFSDDGNGHLVATALAPLAEGNTINTGTHDALADMGFTDGQVFTNPNGGMQRIYSIPVTIPDDSPETVASLLMTVPDLVTT